MNNNQNKFVVSNNKKNIKQQQKQQIQNQLQSQNQNKILIKPRRFSVALKTDIESNLNIKKNNFKKPLNLSLKNLNTKPVLKLEDKNNLNLQIKTNQKNQLNQAIKISFSRKLKKNVDDIKTSRIAEMSLSGIKDSESAELLIQKFIKLKRSKIQIIPTKIYALGGIEEIGKNMYCIEHDEEILIIDCGIKFANKKDLPGISGIIPSFAYLKENEHKVKALIITHGHEDHIGGVPYLLKKINIPIVYAPVIASELIRRKLSEHKNAKLNNLEVFANNSVFYTKNFIIDFYQVNHSIPDSFGIAIASPNGIIASTGDFRFDFGNNPDKTDLQKIGLIATRDVDVLLCESTNAENQGFNETEDNILQELNNIISSCSGRIIISFFASNLRRVEEVIRIGIKRNRKIIILGRSMVGNVAVSRKIGYLKFDDKLLIQPRDINNYPDHEIMIICTGSQGEERAALNTLACEKHAWINLKPSDSVILSSNAIPGNFISVDEVINRLSKHGVKIYLNSPNLKIHSSGHGAKIEQQLLINLLNPKYVVPIHGEYKMLKTLRQNCMELGYEKDNILIITNGQVLHLLNGVLTHCENEYVDASVVYVDGNDATLEGNQLMKQRLEMGENGVIFTQIYLDFKNQKILAISPLTTAGSFYSFDSLDLFKKAIYRIKSDLEFLFKNQKNVSIEFIKKMITSKLAALIWKIKNKKPVIIVNVIDTNTQKLFTNAISLKTIQPKKSIELEKN